MSRLVVIAFENETCAEHMHRALAQLRKPHLISLAEPVVIVREPDGQLRVKSTVALAGLMALFGAFWGVMIGLLFSLPWLGLGIGAAAGAAVGAAADMGVEDRLIKEIGSAIEPGHSALLVFAHDWTNDRVLEKEVAKFDGVLVPTSPSPGPETGLWPAFGTEE
jgi:uncharacterized membrane protein